MGAIIQATGISTDKTVLSSIEHAGIAGNHCIEESGVSRLDIGLIINVGIYRDQNMFEPGMAALIQKKLGVSLDYINLPVRKAAFSFDLMHGAIGALHAMRVADNFLQTDAAPHALIIASEAHPSNQQGVKFPYANLGSAMLLTKGTHPNKGLQAFSFSSTQSLNIGTTGYIKPLACGTQGRETLTLEMATDYSHQALEFSLSIAHPFMDKHRLSPNNTTLISSQIDLDFVTKLANRLHFTEERAPALFKKYGDPFTSSFTLGLHELLTQQSLSAGEQILFLGVSSGITAGCVHYAI